MTSLQSLTRNFACVSFFALLSLCSRAQQWPAGTPANSIYYSAGNVGIGTNNPAANLQVNGTFSVNGGAGHELQGGGGTGAEFVGGYGSPISGRFIFGDASGWKFHYSIKTGQGVISDLMTLMDNGNFGIGNPNPQTRLDLGELRFGPISTFPAEGSIGESVWGNYVLGDVNNLQRLRMGVSNDGYTRAEIFLDNSNRQDGTISLKTVYGAGGAQTRMFIDGNGIVGINTTNINTSYRLWVEGPVRARQVTVDQAAWPDYVFKPTYRLPSLDSVAAYIKAHGHLAGIPSAQEVADKGLSLGENQAAMVKKIEELTLYNIQLEERLKALEATVQKLTDHH
jgi:hypothetical protein